jgi:hypothetical protein
VLVGAIGTYLAKTSTTTAPPTDAPHDRRAADRPVATPAADPAPQPANVSLNDGGIGKLFRAGQSDAFVEAAGVVARILPDDTEGSEHQRFIVRLSTGQTIQIAHNTDLAPRVPVKEGDTVRFRGEYEFTEKGGVIHWTHHNPNPQGRKYGWIDHNGKRYE